MGWVRSRLVMVAAVMALVVISCGGGDGDASSSDGASDSGTTVAGDGSEDTNPPAEPAVAEDTGGSADEAPGERSAVITIDGEATTYALDDVTFSPVEGVGDLTFETCNPDFFGSGRFYAIGYAVDADGELILGEDDQPGTFTMDLPPDDWESAERDAPEFEIKHGGLDIEIATPDEAAGATMAWTIEDTRASGSAVFVDFESSYNVEFEVICEGSPTVNVDALPSDDDATASGGGVGEVPAGGTGSFTVDGESFDNVDVFSCAPFSFGSDPDPRDLSLLGYMGGMTGLEVELSHSEGFDMSDGSQFEQIRLRVFHSRTGDSGTEQFEGSASNNAAGEWVMTDPETFEELPIADSPFVMEGNRISGSLAGLEQTWPDEGAATVDVTWDYEIPTEVLEDC